MLRKAEQDSLALRERMETGGSPERETEPVIAGGDQAHVTCAHRLSVSHSIHQLFHFFLVQNTSLQQVSRVNSARYPAHIALLALEISVQMFVLLTGSRWQSGPVAVAEGASVISK